MISFVDDIITFRYSGGSDPGKTRLIFVTAQSGDYVKGYCFDRDEYRNFSLAKMTRITRITKDCEIIVLEELPSLINIEDVASEYTQKGYLTCINDDNFAAVKDPRNNDTLRFTYTVGQYVHVATKEGNEPVRLQSFSSGRMFTDKEVDDLGTIRDISHRFFCP